MDDIRHMDDISNNRNPSDFRITSERVAAAIKRSNRIAAGEAFYRGFGLGLAVGSVLVGLILWGGVL